MFPLLLVLLAAARRPRSITEDFRKFQKAAELICSGTAKLKSRTTLRSHRIFRVLDSKFPWSYPPNLIGITTGLKSSTLSFSLKHSG